MTARAFARLRSDRDAVDPFDPIDVSIFFTSICNSGCLTCDIWKETARVEFPIGALDDLIVAPSLARATFVLLGGEFTLYGERHRAVRALYEAGRPFVVLTNGILPDRVRALYEHAPLRNLSVSLDGVGARHDAIRGYPGNFARVESLVRWVKSIHPETFLRVCYTASSLNSLEDLASVVRFAEAEGIDDVKVGAVAGAAIYAARTPGNLVLADAELYRFEALFPGDKYLALYRAWKRGWRAPCTGIQRHPVIMSDGSLLLCQNLGVRLGNVLETSFESLWASDGVRARIRSYESCNACWMTCSRKYDAERLTDAEVAEARASVGADA